MSRWTIAPQAQRDLSVIWLYLEENANIEIADRVEAEFYEAFDLLGERPGIGHQRRDVRRSVRFWNVRQYVIIYWPDTVPIEILRLAHGAQDIPRVVGEGKIWE